ncbi:hypothetical protein Bca52824_015161 [Brassica carinata]|uniref:Uncharacterized protein n=1 Tax=Brassica carinata TaxID=52824 RepID=A0A8X7W146_BRACI|nr:hypothetical protein Bca52824_015161 [Brassica carinata]
MSKSELVYSCIWTTFDKAPKHFRQDFLFAFNMSPTKTKWLRSWSVESDDDINHIENISSSPTSLMVSPTTSSYSEITLLQTVDNNINNTPPPPLMVSSLLAIVPYEANKDSIASDDGPSSGAIKENVAGQRVPRT